MMFDADLAFAPKDRIAAERPRRERRGLHERFGLRPHHIRPKEESSRAMSVHTLVPSVSLVERYFWSAIIKFSPDCLDR